MKNISRESFSIYSFTHSFSFFLNRGACFSFLLFPAMFFCCTHADTLTVADNGTSLKVSSLLKAESADSENIQTLDIFAFNPDGTLDCYQQIHEPGESFNIASGSGPKLILLIANSNKNTYEWPKVRNLNSFAGISTNLEQERRNLPLMSSRLSISAGDEANPKMHPIRCEVAINTLLCDFSKESYAAEHLTDVRAYLTYANASCSIIPQSPVQASRLINPGMLDENNLEHFLEKDIIVQEIAKHIGKQSISTDCRLFCYANEPDEESIGSPLTKLVIEGKIAGDTYYYPIKINPQGGGMVPGGKYIFDIIITRAGATHPDGNLKEEDIEVKMKIEQWREKEWYEVEF